MTTKVSILKAVSLSLLFWLYEGGTPVSAEEAAPSAPTDFKSFVGMLIEVIDVLVTFVFALAFLVFIWGIVKAWIIHGGDQAEIDKGKKIALTGVIVLVVMSGIWGILALLRIGLFGI